MPTPGTPPPRDPHPRDVLAECGFRPNRALGQNFLVSLQTMDRIVESAGVSDTDTVLEIGTGLGRLTARLATRAAHVVTVELDRGLHAVAVGRLAAYANVTAVCGDFLASKHSISPDVTSAVRDALRSGDRLKVVSNLPYSISSPAIVDLLEWDVPVGEMYLMLQREVGERLAARPGTRQYGPLTVFADYWAEVTHLFDVPAREFWPVPAVSSVVVSVVRRPGRVMTDDYLAFAEAVRSLFGGRRKTLARNLRAGWGAEAAETVPAELGIDPRARPETLSAEQFRAIAAALKRYGGGA